MSGRRGRPKRAKSSSPRRRTLKVFVEGLETEEQYLVRWHRLHRGAVNVVIDDYRGTPLQLVQHAAAAKRKERRDEKRGQGKDYDEYWCVFDVDEHPNLAAALDMAKANSIKLAISNPCLELWFVLHFEDQTAWIDRSVAQSKSVAYLDCSKSLSEPAFEQLHTQYSAARDRAQRLDAKHEGDGSAPGSNPSSGMWRIVDSIVGS